MTFCPSGVVTYTVLALSPSLSLCATIHLSKSALPPTHLYPLHTQTPCIFLLWAQLPNATPPSLLSFFCFTNQSVPFYHKRGLLSLMFFSDIFLLKLKSCNHPLVCWTPLLLTSSSASLVCDTCPWCFPAFYFFFSLFFYTVRSQPSPPSVTMTLSLFFRDPISFPVPQLSLVTLHQLASLEHMGHPEKKGNGVSLAASKPNTTVSPNSSVTLVTFERSHH